MIAPYINIHTHRRTGSGIEVVSVMAGVDARRAARAAVAAGVPGAAELAGTASATIDLPAPPFSIGIHPWQLGGGNGRGEFINKEFEQALQEIETAPAAAIGEIGLDHAIPHDPAVQTAIFTAQLRIARERHLPVILHCVRAFEPTCEILTAHLPATHPVIFHGFIGSPEQAARALRAGYHLSFGARSLASPKTVEALKRTPLESLFLETDDAPVPIATIYARASELLETPVAEIATQIEKNYDRVVGKN